MKQHKNSSTTKLDPQSIKARKEWMDHWAKTSTQHLEPEMVKRSLRSWQSVARSGLRPPKLTPRHTGGQRG